MESKIEVSVLVISISSPISIGIYKDNNLIEKIENGGKTSDILPSIFDLLLQKYTIKNIYYTNGPGSYMAIKISYIFLKTLSITKKIPLLAANGFEFNDNSPIKALGKKYFFNGEDDKIAIDFIENLEVLKEFKLPSNITTISFSEDTLPNYHLPAV
jgi:tRNA A37 threonylcarbamoyladenosine modification protein TsaB